MSHVSTFLLTWSIEKTASQNMGSFKTIPCLRSDSTAEVVFQGTFSQPRGWHFTQGSINMNLGSSILHHFLREEIKKNENDRMNLFCHECRKFIEGFEDGNVWNIILGWPYLVVGFQQASGNSWRSTHPTLIPICPLNSIKKSFDFPPYLHKRRKTFMSCPT